MVTLLSKIFIKNYTDTTAPQVRQAYGVLSGTVGILFNMLLFMGKFIAGLLSNSIAITADAINNLSDAGSSVITLIGFKMAGQKPDPGHPFGHGRIEYLSGLAVSAAILLMAFELIKSSVSKILHPEDLVFNPVVAGILLVSILIKFYMYLYNRSIGKKIKSEAMLATAKDSLSDTVSTSVVLLTTIVAHYTSLHLDGICGIFVGLFIFYTGITSAKDTLNPLLGQAPDPEFVEEIEKHVMSFPGVIGIHDLIVHNYGPGRMMISLHAEVPADGDILELHDMIDNIERTLRDKLKCDAVIHMDPVCVGDPLVESLKKKISSFLTEMDPSITLHDFRIVKGPTHTNIIFDIVLPYDFKLSDDAVCSLLEYKIAELDASYFAVINVDKKYLSFRKL